MYVVAQSTQTNIEKKNQTISSFHAGVLTDPLAPSTFGAWMSHVATKHVGALSFLVVEFCLFFSVAVLTVIQASQVCLMFLFIILLLQ